MIEIGVFVWTENYIFFCKLCVGIFTFISIWNGASKSHEKMPLAINEYPSKQKWLRCQYVVMQTLHFLFESTWVSHKWKWFTARKKSRKAPFMTDRFFISSTRIQLFDTLCVSELLLACFRLITAIQSYNLTLCDCYCITKRLVQIKDFFYVFDILLNPEIALCNTLPY